MYENYLYKTIKTIFTGLASVDFSWYSSWQRQSHQDNYPKPLHCLHI